MQSTPYEGYVPIRQALDIIKQMVPGLPHPSENIIRNAVKDGTVRAIRVGGPRRTLVHVDDVHGLVTKVDRDINERIRELVSAAPEFSDTQITQIRMLLGNGGDDHAA